jgi:hypothetical protein
LFTGTKGSVFVRAAKLAVGRGCDTGRALAGCSSFSPRASDLQRIVDPSNVEGGSEALSETQTKWQPRLLPTKTDNFLLSLAMRQGFVFYTALGQPAN